MRLNIGTISSSLWADGSLAVAVPIINSGNRTAAEVKVWTVTLGRGVPVTPVSLPSSVGDLVPSERAVLNARFASLVIPGKHRLKVAGTYVSGGKPHTFFASAELAVVRPGIPPGPPTKNLTSATFNLGQQALDFPDLL